MDRVHRQRAPPYRVMFLRACLGQLQRATSDGVPVDEASAPLVKPLK